LFQKQFKHKPEHARILQHHIDEWEKHGFVVESKNYFYNNPIFLVAKSSLKGAQNPLDPSHYRPVLDMRSLNSRIENLITYTPSTRDLIDEISKYSDNPPYQRSMWFSSFDFLQGYMQLKVAEKSRDYLSFTAPLTGAHKTFSRLVFGLNISPYVFNSLMGRILGPLRAKGSLCYYLDDVLLHTTCPNKHIEKIDEFLAVLIDNKLRCSVKKSFLMMHQIKYLGVIVDQHGVRIPPEVNRTLDKLETMPIKTPKQVAKLVGFLNFWRAHIPNLSQRTYHLRQLLKKDVPFRFTQECQQERVDVINALRNADTLQAISPSEPLYLFVDSSYKGIGVSVAQANHPPNDPQSVQRQLTNIRKAKPN
jgi:hypothetical protein